MNIETIKVISELLGVSEENLNKIPDEIKSDMETIIKTITVKNDEDKKMLYNAIDSLWQKGSVMMGLRDVSNGTGIDYTTLCGLDFDTQQEIMFEYMADNSRISHIYEICNNALAVIELENVAKLLSVPIRTLCNLPTEMQEQICGTYFMQYDENDSNANLITELREMLDQ